jgi:hypothetical protein
MKVAQRVVTTLRGRFSQNHRAPSENAAGKISKNDIANVLCVIGLVFVVTSFTATIV